MGAVHLLLLLLNSFYIVPIGASLLSGNSNVVSGRDISLEVASRKQQFLEARKPSIGNALSFQKDITMDTGFVYPHPEFTRQVLSSPLVVVLVLAVLVAFFLRKGLLFEKFTFIFSLAVGALLVSGTKTLPGRLFYTRLLPRAEPLFCIFSRPSRFYPLLIFSYLGILGIGIDQLAGAWKRKVTKPFGAVFLFGWWFLLVIFSYPFWSGKITKRLAFAPHPLSLIVKKLEPGDRRVFKTFKDLPGDFRISFLPPAGLFLTPQRPLSFSWTYKYQGKPGFISGTAGRNPFREFLTSTLFQGGGMEGSPPKAQDASAPAPSPPKKGDLYWICYSFSRGEAAPLDLEISHLGKLFGLANVEYLIYPPQKVYALHNFANFPTRFGRYGYLCEPPVDLENLLSSQADLEKKNAFGYLRERDNILVYRNKRNLSHLYSPQKIVVASGDYTGLVPLSFAREFDLENNTVLFSSQVSKENLEKLKTYPLYFFNQGNRLIDLLLPFVQEEHIIHPGLAPHHFRREWFPINEYWYDVWEFSGMLEKGKGIRSIGKAEGSYPFSLSEEGQFEIYLDAFFSADSAPILVTIDGRDVGKVALERRAPRGFEWVKAGKISLDKGDHELSLRVQEGKNAVQRILVVPEKELEKARQTFFSLSGKNYLSLAEAENLTGQFDLRKAPKSGASQGSFVSLPFRGKIYIPKGRFSLGLRVKTASETDLCLKLENERQTCAETSGRDEFRWADFPVNSREPRIYQFSAQSRENNVQLDLVYLHPAGFSSEVSPAKVDYTQKSPSNYQIKHTRGQLLTFSESYDPRWELTLKSGRKVNPLKAWGNQNLYLLDPEDDPQRLFYAPQKLKTVSLFISLAIWTAALGYLLAITVKTGGAPRWNPRNNRPDTSLGN